MFNKLIYYYYLYREHAQEIWEGIRTAIIFQFLSKAKKAEIRRRRAICASCIHMSANYAKTGLFKTTRKDKFCILCSCNIFIKSASLSSNCGIEELNKRTNDNQPLKWEQFKTNKDDNKK